MERQRLIGWAKRTVLHRDYKGEPTARAEPWQVQALWPDWAYKFLRRYSTACDLTCKPVFDAVPGGPRLFPHRQTLLRIEPCPYHPAGRLTRCELCNDTKKLAL